METTGLHAINCSAVGGGQRIAIPLSSQREAMASRGPRSGSWLCALRGRQLEAAEQIMAWRPVVSMP
eukprot:6737984-Prymnesium_polylepis.1